MRTDVLGAIASSKDVTNAIILTYNIDFVFLQTVVLAALRSCGNPTLTVFADAQCAAESFAHQAPVLDGLGVRYRVVPVAMAPGYRFHPKAVLLSGEKDATLFVGSGNLTFGGWRENAEIWLRFDATVDGSAVFGEFRQFVEEILGRVLLPDAIGAELAEAFDGTTRKWLSEPVAAGSPALLGRAGAGRPLIDRIKDVTGTDPVDELVVCAPYFDPKGAALRALVAQALPPRTTVLCQPRGSTLTGNAVRAAGPTIDVRNVCFKHRSDSGDVRTAFVHAKFYGFVRADDVLLVAGSANCSRAALLANGEDGNAELLAIQNTSVTDFDREFVGELERVESEVVLPDAAPAPDDKPAAPAPRVLAARLDSGTLLVGISPPRAAVHACEIDGAAVPFATSGPGILSVACAAEPRRVRVEADIDGLRSWSAWAWIDHERHLRASARGRNLVDTVRTRMRPGGWSAAAWAEIMDVFCKHLTYMPDRVLGRSGATSTGGAGAKRDTFSYADVFTSAYVVPGLDNLAPLTVKVESGKELSLQKLLLRWFGVLEEEADESNSPGSADDTGDEADDGDGSGSVDDTGDEAGIVDRPEVIRPGPTTPAAAELAERDKRRIADVLKQIEAAMGAEQFLAGRPPDLLAADLKVAAVLLRTGLREGWISAPEFFDTTHRIWMPLFFSGSPTPNQGWLEFRFQHADDPAAWVAAMRSPELAAALLGWAFAVAPRDGSPAWARFELATALAVARLPWLWDGGDTQAVGRELEVLLAHTRLERASEVSVTDAWHGLLRRGHALLRLEQAAHGIPPDVLRSRVKADALRAGELLWQGTAGYCVVVAPTSRSKMGKVPVLRLQQRVEQSQFAAAYTMPVSLLVDESVIPATSGFGDEPRQVLREFVGELAVGLQGGSG